MHCVVVVIDKNTTNKIVVVRLFRLYCTTFTVERDASFNSMRDSRFSILFDLI